SMSSSLICPTPIPYRSRVAGSTYPIRQGWVPIQSPTWRQAATGIDGDTHEHIITGCSLQVKRGYITACSNHRRQKMNTSRRSFLTRSSALLLGAAAAPWAVPAYAANYPDKAVRFYIPYPPGAATDNLGRMAADLYSQAFGQA